MRRTDRGRKRVVLMLLAVLAVHLTIWGTIVYVIVHFTQKYW